MASASIQPEVEDETVALAREMAYLRERLDVLQAELRSAKSSAKTAADDIHKEIDKVKHVQSDPDKASTDRMPSQHGSASRQRTSQRWNPSPRTRTELELGRKPPKNLNWSKWDGEASTFPFYFNKLVCSYNLDAPAGVIGSRERAWALISQTIPPHRELEISAYWQSGGEDGDYNPVNLFRKMLRTFGSVHTLHRALKDLPNCKQSEGQPFGDFYPKWEGILTQAGGASWPDDTKVMQLRMAMHHRLLDTLVPVEMPRDFHAFVQRVMTIAGSFEDTKDGREAAKRWARSKKNPRFDGYRSTGGSFNPPGQQQQQKQSTTTTGPDMDQDGDVIMNAARIIMNAARPGKRNTSNPGNKDSPRAKWVSEDVLTQRREGGK